MPANKEEHSEMLELLERWTNDPQDIKSAFIRLKERISRKENIKLTFISRPGVSYSLRATVGSKREKHWPLFAIIDIIEDDPENRWLSICFKEELINDPDEEGELIPEGLLGEDGYCFNLYQDDESLIFYIEQRIDEAHTNISVPR